MSLDYIRPLSEQAVSERAEAGLWTPLHAGEGLRVVDCSDDRSLTEENYQQRVEQFQTEVSPGRYFGAASGLAIASLSAFATEHGEAAVLSFVDDYSPEGFVDYAANLSDRAYRSSQKIELNQHSDNNKEGTVLGLGDHKICEDPLGCAFAIKLGTVLLLSTQKEQVDEAKAIAAINGAPLPIDEAVEGLTIMMDQIPVDFGIHRGALHYAQTRTQRHTPIAIVKGHHAPNDEAAVVFDMAGYRSNANRHNAVGIHRYHHTPSLATELMPTIVPEIKFDPDVLSATGLLLGTATRRALSGENTPTALRVEVLPSDYALRAA